MEPSDDPELRRVLREWQVPDAPPALLPPPVTRPSSVWTSWLRTDIRVPVPVAVAVAILVIWLVASGSRERTSPVSPVVRPASADDLRGFEPVNAVNVRIERSGDAAR